MAQLPPSRVASSPTERAGRKACRAPSTSPRPAGIAVLLIPNGSTPTFTVRQPTASRTQSLEPELRRQLDLAIGRALVEHEYAAALLADPTVALGTHDCLSHHYFELRRIRASSLEDFACQAWEVFWPSSDRSLDSID